MQAASATRTPQPLTEQIILFRVSGHTFAISSASVQEVRSVDNIAAMAQDLPDSTIRKVRQAPLRHAQSD